MLVKANLLNFRYSRQYAGFYLVFSNKFPKKLSFVHKLFTIVIQFVYKPVT